MMQYDAVPQVHRSVEHVETMSILLLKEFIHHTHSQIKNISFIFVCAEMVPGGV